MAAPQGKYSATFGINPNKVTIRNILHMKGLHGWEMIREPWRMPDLLRFASLRLIEVSFTSACRIWFIVPWISRYVSESIVYCNYRPSNLQETRLRNVANVKEAVIQVFTMNCGYLFLYHFVVTVHDGSTIGGTVMLTTWSTRSTTHPFIQSTVKD